MSALGDVADAASWAQQAAWTQGAQQAAQAEGGESLPQWFDEELFSLDGCDAVRVAADGAVVGFETDVEAVQALDGIAARWPTRGWTRVDSGVQGNAAFVKGGGTCRWAWVSCTGVAARRASSCSVRRMADEGAFGGRKGLAAGRAAVLRMGSRAKESGAMEERPMGKALGKERPAGRGLRGKRRKSQWEKGRWNRREGKAGRWRGICWAKAPRRRKDGRGLGRCCLWRREAQAGRAGFCAAGPSEDALLLAPCRDIHTVGMRRPIDVAFVDKTGRVVEAHRAVGPLRRLRNASAAAVIERFAACGPWFQPGDRVGLSCVRAVQRAERIEDAGPPPQGRRARGARKAHGGRRAPAARKADGGCRGAAKAEKREVEERRQP